MYSLVAQSTKTIRVENPLSEHCLDQVVVINREEFPPSIFTKFSEKILLFDLTGGLIPIQFDDVDQDGQWDECALLLNLLPLEVKELSMMVVSDSVFKTKAVFPKRTNIRLAKSPQKNGNYIELQREVRPVDHLPQSHPMLYQYEGVGWESDRVAFRSYFDARNGKDIFGKCKPALVLDTIGFPGQDYHKLSDWGMDVLKVGSSLGAGALALQIGDTLYRLGATQEATFETIFEGPVRSRLKLRYEGWLVAGDILNLTEWITIEAGSYSYSSYVQVEGLKKTANLVTGIVNLKNKAKRMVLVKANKGWRYLLSLAPQSELGDQLGMAILFPGKQYSSIQVAPDSSSIKGAITHTFLVKQKLDKKFSGEFYFYSFWQKSMPEFADQNFLLEWMNKEADKRLWKPAVKWN
jgi:hypothetical protein